MSKRGWMDYNLYIRLKGSLTLILLERSWRHGDRQRKNQDKKSGLGGQGDNELIREASAESWFFNLLEFMIILIS